MPMLPNKLRGDLQKASVNCGRKIQQDATPHAMRPPRRLDGLAMTSSRFHDGSITDIPAYDDRHHRNTTSVALGARG
jgi:hypothetical protein